MTLSIPFFFLMSSLERRPTLIAIDGKDFPAPVATELQTLLGPGFRVTYRAPRAPRSNWNHPDVLLFAYADDEIPYSSQISIDGFVPGNVEFLRFAKKAFSPSRIIVVLPPPRYPSSDYAQVFKPLVKQMAREANAELFDLSGSTNLAHDLYVEFATFQRNPGAWHLVSATSEQTDEGPAKNAIDNNPETYWHTRYDPEPTKVPHEIIIDLGKTQSLNGFSYLARQDGGVNGRVKDYEIYVSNDQTNWGEPAMKGTLQNSMNEQRLLFPKTATGRYLKFKALTEVNGNIWTSIAELGILPTGKPK